MRETYTRSVFPSNVRPGLSTNPQQVTSVWMNPDRRTADRYSSVFILALARDQAVRTIVETDLATVASARKVKATRSIDIYPNGLWGEGAPTRNELWDKIKELGCDAIYTVSPLNVKSEQRYAGGTGAYSPHPKNSFYAGFDMYYEHVAPVVSTPGYYTAEKKFFLEGNVFDARSGEIQWSMQSIAYDPVDLDSFSKEYALLLIDQLNRS